MSSIVIKELNKSYNNGNENLHILNGLDLTVEPETKVILTGSSGSGKSTLLNLMAGLDTITSGSVIIDGYPVHELKEYELADFRAGRIGLIFQFHYLLKDFNALENVMIPAYMTGRDKKEALEDAERLLCEVGLEERLNHLPSQLSGGERQRVAVARSLINNPPLVLADEPTGNLDEKNSDIVEELLFNLVSRHGKTLLLVTHDSGIAERGDRRLKLENGILEEI